MTDASMSEATARAAWSYDPTTGELFWKINRASNARAGRPAGATRPDGYRVVAWNGVSYLAHRVAWLIVTGEWPALHIDHVNGDPSDNRWSNLRLATRHENLRNRGKNKNNTSGFKGVSKYAGGGWRARIFADGKEKHLGHFATREAAAAAYREAATTLHGEFANVGDQP